MEDPGAAPAANRRAPTRPRAIKDPAGEAAEMAVAAGLVYVSDSDPGIRRLRKGKDFAYTKADNRPPIAAAELARTAPPAIPPAYEEVWICANPRGHLQATGRDARRRKQYRYHPEWRPLRDGGKIERMIEFRETLPRLRPRLPRHPPLPRLAGGKMPCVIVRPVHATRRPNRRSGE